MQQRVWADSILEARITRELGWEPQLQNITLDVRVTDGIAVLRGELATRSQRRAVELAAARVPGVRQVVNLTSVMGQRSPSDADLALAVADALRQSGVPGESGIHVIVKNGRVTLAGSVAHERERLMIVAAVGVVPGVLDVVNLIRVIDEPAGNGAERGVPTRGDALEDSGATAAKVETPAWMLREHADLCKASEIVAGPGRAKSTATDHGTGRDRGVRSVRVKGASDE